MSFASASDSSAVRLGFSGSTGSGSGSGATSASATASSSGSGATTTSSGASSGSSGSLFGMVTGAVTYNAQVLTHPGYVGLFTSNPAIAGAQAVAFAATDATGAYQLGPVDAGTYWLAASYGPGLLDAGELSYADGGLTPGAVAGELLQEPLQVEGSILPPNLDLSEVTAAMAVLTVNVADAPDAGIPSTGGIALSDGGELYPLLVVGLIGGNNPVDGMPVSDAVGATFGTDGGPTYTMAFHAGAPTDLDYEKYSYNVPFAQPSSWQAVTAGTYFFTLTGSATLGATETRQIDVQPFTEVPIITSPADLSSQTANLLSGVVVAWADPSGATGAELNVKDSADGSSVCKLAYPQTTPVTLGAGTGCAFSLGHHYLIEVLSLRLHAQAQGGSFEEAYARVRIAF